MAKGDAVAAMEAFAALAAKRDAKRERSADPDELEDEERRKRAEPLLNKTAFERRRTTAVYKDDGSRGHHMGVGGVEIMGAGRRCWKSRGGVGVRVEPCARAAQR